MARKAKKKLHPMPKLSALDQCIYMTILALIIAVTFSGVLLPVFLRRAVAAADAAIAVMEDASILWCFPACFSFFLITFIPLCLAYQGRYPIFGKRNFRYGPPAWPKIYPVFMKNKPVVWVSENKKKQRRNIAILLLVVFLICCLPLPLSLFGRDSLYADGSVADFNMFNRKVREYTVRDVDSVIFRVARNGKRSGLYDIVMEQTMTDGRRFQFEDGDFLRREDGDWLSEMVRLKALFPPEKVVTKGHDKLELVVFDRDMDSQQAALLYALFS